MINLNQSQEPSPLSTIVQHMALHVHDQSHLLLMDIRNGTHVESLESRLGCIAGAVAQLENMLGSYRRMNSNELIHEPNDSTPICRSCHILDISNR